MAFQTGTQIDPRLLDYSGYAQGMVAAAGIEAQALADLGSQVGQAVDDLRQKKKEKKQKKFIADSFIRMGKANEELGEMILPGFASAEADEQQLAANQYVEGLGIESANKLNMALLSSFLDSDDKPSAKYSDIGSFLKTVDELPQYSREDGKIMYDPTPGGMFTSGDKREVRPDDKIFTDYGFGQEMYDLFYDPKGVR